MFRARPLVIALTLAVGISACGTDESTVRPASGTAAVPNPPASNASSPAETSATGSARASESPSAGPVIVPGCDPSSGEERGGLTGIWEADDDGLYYIHETGDGCVWWFGSDVGRTTGNTFANVAVGQIEGDLIHLQWADVPYGRTMNGGVLTLEVSSDGTLLTKIAATGGFGGGTWTRTPDLSSPGASESATP